MWIRIPSTSYPPVPEAMDWTSASDWQSPMLARSAALNTKPMPVKSWQRAWTKKKWMKRLYGRILKPSMAARGAESWIALLQATRARASVRPVSALDPMTLARFGRTLSELPMNQKCHASGGKTSPAQTPSNIISSKSSPTWKELAFELRQYSSELRTLVPRINASGFSRWPTARMEDAESCGNHPGAQDSLTGITKNWATPVKADCEGTHGGRMEKSLRTDVAMWQTPKSPDGGNISRSGDRKGEKLLGGQAKHWPTPKTPTGGPESAADKAHRPDAGGGDLQASARDWPTPNASDGDKAPSNYARGNPSLPGKSKNWMTPHGLSADQGQGDGEFGKMARNWPTPMVRGYKSGSVNPETTNRNSRPLSEAAYLFSPQDPKSLKTGAPSSKSTKRLNPRFVEWLMGWPIGWTDCASREMELYQWQQRMRSLLSRLISGCGDA